MTRIIKKPGELFAGASDVLPIRAPVLTSVFALALALPLPFSSDAAQAQGAPQERSPQTPFPQETFPQETSQKSFEIFDIGAQPLQNALLEFSEQTDIVVVAPAGLVRGKTAPRVSGQFAPYEALERLLQGSGLHYARGRDGEVTIIAVPNNSDVLTHNSGAQMAQIQPDRNVDEAGQTPVVGQDRDTPQQQQEDELLEIEEIVITGSHIRGVGISVGSRVDVIDRLEIDRSGFATTQQLLQSLPTNFQGGPSEDTFVGTANSNFSGGSGVNLRGLGTSSTLVLVNGRRIPIAGQASNFFDISNIPVTAIERVEVLHDGASAIYGADAIAGVVNVILRQDYEGAETTARFGTVTDGGLQEYQAGQVFGTKWGTGNLLASFEYYKRDNLSREERRYTADADLSRLGGDNFRSIFSNPGNILNPITFQPLFAIPPGQDGTSLLPSDFLPAEQANLQNTNEGVDTLPEQERYSLYVTLTQDVTEDVELYAEGRFSKRDFEQRQLAATAPLFVPSTNAFFVDPVGGSPFLSIAYNFFDDLGPTINAGDVESYGGVFGVRTDIGSDWSIDFYSSYSEEQTDNSIFNNVDFTSLAVALAAPDPEMAFNPFGDGSNTNPAVLEMVRSTVTRDLTSDLWSGNLVADGPLFDLPGGEVRLAIGADYREESFELLSGVGDEVPAGSSLDRDITALFAEVFIPFFSEQNQAAGIKNLVVSAAVRYEDYGGIGNIGDTTNPKFGVLWSPIEDINIRGTWGTSFKAPNLVQLNETSNIDFLFPIIDPSSPTGFTTSLIRLGNNANLKNETATTWTLSAEYTPSAVPGLGVDLTYFNIDFQDRVSSPPVATFVFLEEEKFSGLINRTPTQEEIDAICTGPLFFGDPASCNVVPIGAIVDGRLNNTSTTKVEGLDFNITYGFDTTNAGRFNFHINGSYLFKFTEAFSATSPAVELVDTVHNPVDFRMRNSLTWSNDSGFAATAYLNYTDSYTDNVSDPERKVDSWTTVDLTLSYNTGSRPAVSAFKNIVFRVSIQNLFDNEPPFVNNTSGIGYDPENAHPLDRFISFSLTKKW